MLIDELRIIIDGIRGRVHSVGQLIEQTTPRFWAFVWLFPASGLVLMILVASVPGCVYKQNLHAVQLALERFATDSPAGNYPVRIEQIIEDGYLEEMPMNPFTGQPMRWKAYDSYDYARSNPDGLSHGDFGYITRTDRGWRSERSDQPELNSRDVTSYTLVLY